MTLLHLAALFGRLAVAAVLSPAASAPVTHPRIVIVCTDEVRSPTADTADSTARPPGLISTAASLWPFSAVVGAARGTYEDAVWAWDAVTGADGKKAACDGKRPAEREEKATLPPAGRFLRKMCT